MQIQRINFNSQNFGSINISPEKLQKTLKMVDNRDFQSLIKMAQSKNKPEANVTKMIFNWIKGLIKIKQGGYEITEDIINSERNAAIKKLGKNGTEGITAALYNYTLGRLDGCCYNSYLLKDFRKKGKYMWPPAQ